LGLLAKWNGTGTVLEQVEQTENVPYHFLNEVFIYAVLSGTKAEQAFHYNDQIKT